LDLYNNLFESEEVIHSIQQALREDIGDGDHTSLATIPANQISTARVMVKASGVIAGVQLANTILRLTDASITTEIFIADGAMVEPGDVVMLVQGTTGSLLRAERILLNYMQHLSGVETATARLVNIIQGTGAQLLDTRKTTPGLRILEKWAVTMGGGSNHRIGLYDMIMIKDNHIDAAGGIKPAIEKAHAYKAMHEKTYLKVEVETRNIQEVREVLATGLVDRIMLDNFSPEQMRDAVQLINGAYETEASGGIHAGTIRAYAETGVTYISVGAITHSAPALDISMKIL
jgi:nicotinate-nucleotide pyrophosphorylase (carboxylating)